MVSFVIPAYNAEKTIVRSIKSILNQKKSKVRYEIIVVDDGSTDETAKVVKELNEPKIRLVKNDENKGVAESRNIGVKRAKGDYIIFVDSDDFVESGLLKDIESYVAKKSKVDLVKWYALTSENFDNHIANDLDTENNFPTTLEFENISGEEAFNKLYGTEPYLSSLWCYAIRKSNIIEFPKNKYHEDFAVMPLIILNSKNVVSTGKFEYNYILTEDSIMRTTSEEHKRKLLGDILENYDNLIEEVQKLDIEPKTKENVATYGTYALAAYIPDLRGQTKKNFIHELKERNIAGNIKVRGPKSLIKKIMFNIKY